jgi:hypothetical protein
MMRPNLFAALIVCSTALLLIAAGASKPRNDTAPLAVLTGNDSHVKARTYERIASPTDWKKTWLKHLGMKEDTIYRPAMEVDFDRCEVVALFEGESWNTCGFVVHSVTERDDSILLRVEGVYYQTEGDGDCVAPFAFVVVPKSSKPITLEQSDPHFPNEPPRWKEVARFAAKKR